MGLRRCMRSSIIEENTLKQLAISGMKLIMPISVMDISYIVRKPV